MTLSDLLTEIRQEVQETTAAEWTDAEITSYINEGCRLVAQALEWHQKTGNLVPVVGTQDYTLPGDILVLQRVTFDRQFLIETTQYELDRDEGNWRAAGNGDPIRHFEKQWDTLSLYPKPETAGTTVSFDAEVGIITRIEDPSGTSDADITFDSELGVIIAVEDDEGGQIRFEHDLDADPFGAASDAELGCVIDYSTDELNVGLFYSALPDTLSATTDSPQSPSFVHPALVPYAVYRCLSREGPMQDWRVAVGYFEDFIDWTDGCMSLKAADGPKALRLLRALREVRLLTSVFQRLVMVIHCAQPFAPTMNSAGLD